MSNEIFSKLCRGTNFRGGPSSKLVLYKSQKTGDSQPEAEPDVTFDDRSRVSTLDGELFTDYEEIERFEDICQDSVDKDALKEILEALRSRLKIKLCTPIQKHVLPIALKGEDVVAVAPTGSGKTLSYLIPILLNVKVRPCSPLTHSLQNDNSIKALVITPTVELVQQVKRECIFLTGEDGIKVSALEKSQESFDAPLAISTPKTLLTLLEKFEDMLKECKYLVLDEVDKLLEDGYVDHIDKILEALRTKNVDAHVQKMIFSSTLQQSVLSLVSTFMPNAIHVTIGSENCACTNVSQELVCVTNDKGKLMTLRQLILEGKLIPPVLVFLQTIERVNELYNELKGENVRVQKFTSELTVSKRAQIIEKFRTGEIWILLCTDILARGVDFKGIDSVVNFDLPLTPQVYINRVGRAGRGLKKGRSITFFTLRDLKIMKHIVQIMKISGAQVPDYLQDIQENGKVTEKRPPNRGNISKR
ncbi:DEAD box ATP-dependent RNA helicase family member protein [Theileria equi strain WA]|uniref:RNA helicase n=1 Tax=Theileria equi strain WA TaxID=1537102 RepID=L1LB99_THEEQ|nr:DEAD box ATP-dependent RNA helicase family member protein [Theileria equi strain WA]EKX72606.1 DEAD box ATP-dependent RNA helicase family member protein [Theileria equi strain WA]|eukprot:XP_004832058.1 DEAD box ATP-dependent RNA helicase family member protein [Theileria equi strain WA]